MTPSPRGPDSGGGGFGAAPLPQATTSPEQLNRGGGGSGGPGIVSRESIERIARNARSWSFGGGGGGGGGGGFSSSGGGGGGDVDMMRSSWDGTLGRGGGGGGGGGGVFSGGGLGLTNTMQSWQQRGSAPLPIPAGSGRPPQPPNLARGRSAPTMGGAGAGAGAGGGAGLSINVGSGSTATGDAYLDAQVTPGLMAARPAAAEPEQQWVGFVSCLNSKNLGKYRLKQTYRGGTIVAFDREQSKLVLMYKETPTGALMIVRSRDVAKYAVGQLLHSPDGRTRGLVHAIDRQQNLLVVNRDLHKARGAAAAAPSSGHQAPSPPGTPSFNASRGRFA